jgi:hypothetical protein
MGYGAIMPCAFVLTDPKYVRGKFTILETPLKPIGPAHSSLSALLANASASLFNSRGTCQNIISLPPASLNSM